MKKVNRWLIYCIVLFLFSCSPTLKTYKEQFHVLDEKIALHDYAGAITYLESLKDQFYKKKDRVIFYLDLGMLYHYNKEYEKSNEILTKAEQAIEELYAKSISRAVTSLLLNDNVLEYDGEDYENIYLNFFKALNYLQLHSFDEAFVEVRRINDKAKVLDQKYNDLAKAFNRSKDAKLKLEAGKSKFHNSALSDYLSLLMYRTEGNLDDAYIDFHKFEEAWETQSDIYDFQKPDIKKSLIKSPKAKVNVFAFSGKAPDKKAKTLYVHTEKDMIIIGTTEESPKGRNDLETLNTFPWKDVKEGYHFKFQIPFLERRDSQVTKIKVIVNNNETFTLSKMESLANVAEDTFRTKEPIIYIKTILRSVIKGLFAEKRKEEMEQKIDNPLLGFAARMATDIAMDATENADLRISRFFPCCAYAGEIRLEPGIYDFRIEYYGKNNTLLHSEENNQMQLKNNQMNLIESYFLQ